MSESGRKRETRGQCDAETRRVSRLQRRLVALTRDDRGHSLESILEGHLERVLAVDRELDALAARTAVLETNGRRALQRFQSAGDERSVPLFEVAQLALGVSRRGVGRCHAWRSAPPCWR